MANSFTHEKRRSMTPQRIARVFQLRGGRCGDPDLGEKNWGCGRKLGPSDDYRIEHSVALENGGTDDEANLYISCEWCWPDKDADDHSTAGHGRRMATKHCVPKRFRAGKGWRR